jgi:hypothetical protein
MKWQNYTSEAPNLLWNFIIIVQDFMMSVILKNFSVGLLH